MYVRDWFDLDTDLKPFYEMAENDLLLQKAVDEFYGLRNIGIPDLFEALCLGDSWSANQSDICVYFEKTFCRDVRKFD